MVSTDAGMQIDRRDEHLSNAYSPSIETLNPVSNLTFERPSQWEKQDFKMALTDEGTQTDDSLKHF
jgi:hypothetical protein